MITFLLQRSVLMPLLFGAVLLSGLFYFDSLEQQSEFSAAALISVDEIVYPVEELGGCADAGSCRAHCDEVAHLNECIDFAESRGLISGQEAIQGRRFAEAGGVGPGGCTTRASCEEYCAALDHITECVAFAERTGALPAKELAEAKKIAAYIGAGGVMPAGCQNKESCMSYCRVPENMEECLDFAEAADLISPRELAEARKVMPFLIRGETPGGCIQKEQCDAYCASVEHMEECILFAERAGLIPPEELKMAKKVLPFMVRGETPGGCISKEECDAYCQQPTNFRECVLFAERAGLMSKAELFMLKQMMRLVPEGQTVR